MQKAHTPRAGAPLRRALRGATALGVAVLVLVPPATANAYGIGTLPNVPSYLPAGLGVLEPLIPSGLTVSGAVVAGGEGALAVGGGVIAGVALVGGGLMYLSWKLGGQIGEALPCLDCATASSPTTPDTTNAATGVSVVQSWSGNSASFTISVPSGTWNVQQLGYGQYGFGTTTAMTTMIGPLTRSFTGTNTGGYGPFSGACATATGPGYGPTQSAIFYVGATDNAGCGASSVNTSLAGPAGPTGQPLAVSTTTTFRNSDGTTGTSTATGTAFHATDPVFPPITVPPLQPGQTRVGFGATVVPLNSGSSVTPTTLVPPMTLPTSAPADRPDLGRCLPGGVDYPCALVLTHHLPDGSTKPYDPSVDYNGGAPPIGSYDCQAGGKAVPLSDCQPVYRQTPVRPGTTTGTLPEPPSDGGNCVASGVSFNPVSWIYIPVKCALIWAFVPTSVTTAAVAATSADFRSRVPVSWLLEASGFVGTALGGATSPASGCLTFDVDLARLGRYHILDSCNEAEPIVHAVRGLRTITGAAELLAFLGPLAWWAWKSYAPLATPNG